MPALDVADGFDVHEYRSGFKLLKQDGDSMHLENYGEFACPACGEVFDRLFVTDADTVTFGSSPTGPICLVRTPDQLLVTTH
ncbi:MAG: flagella cluster protein [Halanaeroarchaeum sp.]